MILRGYVGPAQCEQRSDRIPLGGYPIDNAEGFPELRDESAFMQGWLIDRW